MLVVDLEMNRQEQFSTAKQPTLDEVDLCSVRCYTILGSRVHHYIQATMLSLRVCSCEFKNSRLAIRASKPIFTMLVGLRAPDDSTFM